MPGKTFWPSNVQSEGATIHRSLTVKNPQHQRIPKVTAKVIDAKIQRSRKPLCQGQWPKGMHKSPTLRAQPERRSLPGRRRRHRSLEAHRPVRRRPSGKTRFCSQHRHRLLRLQATPSRQQIKVKVPSARQRIGNKVFAEPSHRFPAGIQCLVRQRSQKRIQARRRCWFLRRGTVEVIGVLRPTPCVFIAVGQRQRYIRPDRVPRPTGETRPQIPWITLHPRRHAHVDKGVKLGRMPTETAPPAHRLPRIRIPRTPTSKPILRKPRPRRLAVIKGVFIAVDQPPRSHHPVQHTINKIIDPRQKSRRRKIRRPRKCKHDPHFRKFRLHYFHPVTSTPTQ